MSKKDRDICNAAAKRAPWRLRIPTDGTLMVWPDEKHIVAVARTHREDESKFIAHFNPSKVSKMLNALDAKEAEIKRLRKRNELLTDHYECKMHDHERATKLEEMVAQLRTELAELIDWGIAVNETVLDDPSDCPYAKKFEEYLSRYMSKKEQGK